MRLARAKTSLAAALAALLTLQQGLFAVRAAEVEGPVRAAASSVLPTISLPTAAALFSPLLAAPSPVGAALAAPGAMAAAIAAPPLPAAAAPAAACWPAAVKKTARRALSSLTGRSAPEASGLFDGAAAPLPDDPSPRVFLVREDGRKVQATVRTLSAALARDPAFARRLNARGLVRLVVAAKDEGLLKRADTPAVEAELKDAGLTARVDVEKLALKPARETRTDGPPESAAGKLWSELAYLPRAFVAALDKPTKTEILGGLASKGPAFALSAIWWIAKLWPSAPLEPKMAQLPALIHHVATGAWTAPAHPLALAGVLGLSLALETFHGIWIATWQNFQNIIAKQRGTAYQTVFNLSYMQSTGALFRFITWTAVAGTIAPWTLRYWRDMGAVTLAGTFIGTLGYQGLNEFYNKGTAKRWLRSLVQQGRDLFFLLGGVFFASGSMGVYWPLFLAAQSIDLGLYVLSRTARPRPIAYVADPRLAAAPEFSATYPVGPAPRSSPLREAAGALVNNPLSKVLVMAAKKLGGLFRRTRR